MRTYFSLSRRKPSPAYQASYRMWSESCPTYPARGVALIALVEDVLGDLVLGAVEGNRVRSGGEFVGAMVTVVEQGGRSVSVHVVVAGIPELAVCVR